MSVPAPHSELDRPKFDLAELTADLPKPLSSDPGLFAEVREIDGYFYFVFTGSDDLTCQRCASTSSRASSKPNHPECLVRVEGYIAFLKWCYNMCTGAIGPGVQRPSHSSCKTCNKNRSSFCRIKCVDRILGSEWIPKGRKVSNPIPRSTRSRATKVENKEDIVQERPRKRKRKRQNDGIVDSFESSDPPLNSFRVSRRMSSLPATTVAPVQQAPLSISQLDASSENATPGRPRKKRKQNNGTAVASSSSVRPASPPPEAIQVSRRPPPSFSANVALLQPKIETDLRSTIKSVLSVPQLGVPAGVSANAVANESISLLREISAKLDMILEVIDARGRRRG
ncbi:hypothetical protein BDN70DRAFT_885560 [Pholiota conissans]|uniref:Uncharacterized protein n=1 Tax=Pholiota conissans TaxID=109636 RepID=A0A9P5YS72_9AGAR|nr:hypothetical protein BDN70DRAFT_885560 [Pholiota conissans]